MFKFIQEFRMDIPDNSTNREFKNAMLELSIPYIRIVILVCIFLFAAFWGFDWYVDPSSVWTTLPVRIVLCSYFFVMYLIIRNYQLRHNHWILIYSLGVVVVVTGIQILDLNINNDHHIFHGSLLFVVIVICVIGPYPAVSIPLLLFTTLAPDIISIASIKLDIYSAKYSVEEIIMLSFMDITALILGFFLIKADDKIKWEIFNKGKELEELSVKDQLTTLLNRRGFKAEYNREMKRQKRYGTTSALLMLDIDHFKKINDKYGHNVGDKVLVTLSRHWKSTLRDTDVIARIGGEEFVVLLPHSNLNISQELAERIRSTTESLPVSTTAGVLSITVSIGVKSIPPEGIKLKQALDMADKALYQAKNSGRNRVEVAEISGPAV